MPGLALIIVLAASAGASLPGGAVATAVVRATIVRPVTLRASSLEAFDNLPIRTARRERPCDRDPAQRCAVIVYDLP